MSIDSLFAHFDGLGFKVISVILSTLWQSSLLFLGTGMLARFLRKRGDAVRHLLWVSAVFVCPLLPLVTTGTVILGSPHAEIALIPEHEEPGAPVTHAISSTPDSMGLIASERRDTVSPSIPSAETFRLFDHPYALAFASYMVGLATLLLWMLAARLRIRRWILDGDPVLDSRVLDAFRGAAFRNGLPHEYPVIEHPDIPAPLTCRIVRPVIMLPRGFASGLTEGELRAVAQHETAHILRRDTLVFTLVALVRTLFFFQPLVWYASRRISHHAEIICDSAALAHGNDPTSYAELLTRIAFRLPEHSLSEELAAGILFTNSSFFIRIRSILSGAHAGIRPLSRLSAAGIVATGIVCLAVAAAFPLVERSSGSPKRVPDVHPSPAVSRLIATNRPAAPSSGAYTVPSAVKNRIIVDGNLADWNATGAETVRLTRGSVAARYRSNRMSPPSPDVLSADLRCAADDDFLYLGVAVADDRLVFEGNSFGWLWERDCLEILFYSDMKPKRAGQILVTLDSDGSLVIGGSDPITDRKYPYLWESLGVKAALKKTPRGYIVELAVPFSVLEWSGWTGDRLRGLNVRVYDDDMRKQQYLAEWPDDESGWEPVILPSSPAAAGHMRFQARDYEIIRTVLTHYSQHEYKKAFTALRTAGDGPWVEPMRGILMRNSDVSQSSAAFDNAMKKARSPVIRRWIRDNRPSLFEKKQIWNWVRASFGMYRIGTEKSMEEKIQKASTPEKKAAIEKLLRFWRGYRYHDLSILMCADMILKTDRNIPVIEEIAEYSLREGSNTLIYIGIAKHAARSKKASREFVDLASVVEREGGHAELINLARDIAKARNEDELRPLREDIAALK